MTSVPKPLIIQADRSILLDVHAPEAVAARKALVSFAELEKSPEHLHSYRLTPLSLWNAASAGFSPQMIAQTLTRFSRFTPPQTVLDWVVDIMSLYGKIRLREDTTHSTLLRLQVRDAHIAREIAASKSLASHLSPTTACLQDGPLPTPDTARIAQPDTTPQVQGAQTGCSYDFLLPRLHRGTVKQLLLRHGWPVHDEVPLREGTPLSLRLRISPASCPPPSTAYPCCHTPGTPSFVPRDYQWEAADAFVGNRTQGSGFGVVVLPCGAGKTVVGLLVMGLLQTDTLILTPNSAAAQQWKRELCEKTDLDGTSIGIYSGECKEIRPVTIATYQILTWRAHADAPFSHFRLFMERSWGLIIYDEVHLLPAPLFRITAELQVVRRLGLTATLVREDGCAQDVFSLVGPKRYDVPWKDLEARGWIARVRCVEVRVTMDRSLQYQYMTAPVRLRHRLASENEAKVAVVQRLLRAHAGAPTLIIGQYVQQLLHLAHVLQVPLVSGRQTYAAREAIYQRFREGTLQVLVVSKVANCALDLPDASVAIQVSGTFGSRQEEAQRLGRLLRPKICDAHFYSLVTEQTVEEDCALRRQRFLVEQGYTYETLRVSEVHE